MLADIKRSLTDLVGVDYIQAVCRASSSLGLGSFDELIRLAEESIEFYPLAFEKRCAELAAKSGELLCEGLANSSAGATTDAFAKAFHQHSAPLSGMGAIRIGENGRIAIAGRSEHYQASLGHNFPGYKLLEIARKIGITNITHNNTRGHITRLLEQELVRVANGLKKGDSVALRHVLDSKKPHVLNRVINLETGSLACESAFKMALARFYRLQKSFPAPPYAGRIPVFVVMADLNGGKEANYHGTCVLTQLMRGMWHEMYDGMEKASVLKIVPTAFNNTDAFRKVVEQYDSGKYKIALFTHELVLMNYGGVKLEEAFVRETHDLCHEHDIPVFVDEIQSCIWSPGLFLFRDYQCHPDFVSVGKGFPGGQFPASKILTTAVMDNLNQFGALVTNGQEEFASLANLITIEFAEANAEHTRAMSNYWHRSLEQIRAKYDGTVKHVDGAGMLTSIFFDTQETTVRFCTILGEKYGLDTSAQSYKGNCPPVALLKPPLIADNALLDRMTFCIEEALKQLIRQDANCLKSQKTDADIARFESALPQRKDFAQCVQLRDSTFETTSTHKR